MIPLKALQTAMLKSALAQRATDSLGPVAAGKLADLVLLDADPLVDLWSTTKLRSVMANGRYFDHTALEPLKVRRNVPRTDKKRSGLPAIGLRAIGVLATGVLAASPLRAQDSRTADTMHVADTTTPDGRGAISEADVRRHLGVITRDSMRERATPNPGLEQTAQYVAAQFQAAGLVPVRRKPGSWVQRYPVPGYLAMQEGQSRLVFLGVTRHGKSLVAEDGDLFDFRGFDFRFAAFVASDTVLEWQALGARERIVPVVIAGAHTLASVRQANIRNKVVVYVPAPGGDSTLQRQVIALLHATNHVIVVVDEDSAAFAARRRAAQAHPPVILDPYLPEAQRTHRWVVDVWAPAIEGALAMAGFNLAAARTASAPVVRELEATALLQVMTEDSTTGPTAPNTLGMVRGSDPSQVVMLVAHMDRAGVRQGAAERIASGANDNASGVAGLLALAKAFTQAGVPPRRTIVFAAVSGGANDFWGSHNLLAAQWPVLGEGRIVLAISLDMIGRTPGDSLWVDGVPDLELPVRPGWVAAQQPGVPLTLVDSGTAVTPTSDHFAFVQKAIPSLYVHTSVHGAPETGLNDRPAADAAVDAEQEVRVLRFVYRLTRALANAEQAPRWTRDGRQRLGEVLGK